MAQNIVGLFADRISAEHAIVDLKAAGFDPQHMGIVMQDKQEAKDVASDQGLGSTTGAVTGGVIGGTAGALLAATGALIIPGIGPFISGGILATSLVGGAAGWLVGGLVGLGISKDDAEYYQGRVEQGSVLLTVSTNGRDAEAYDIMQRNGAEQTRTQGNTGTTGMMANAAPRQPMTSNTSDYPTAQSTYATPGDGSRAIPPDPLPTTGADMHQSMQNQGREAWTDQPMNQPIDQGIGQPMNQGMGQPMDRGMDQPMAGSYQAQPRAMDNATDTVLVDGRPMSGNESRTLGSEQSERRPVMDQDILRERGLDTQGRNDTMNDPTATQPIDPLDRRLPDEPQRGR